MKKVLWICLAAAAVAITILSIELGHSVVMCRHLKRQVADQTVIIDSLLKRRMTVFDVQMHVTDKSHFAIYGRYNKGTINVPNERRYVLEVDSVNLKMR